MKKGQVLGSINLNVFHPVSMVCRIMLACRGDTFKGIGQGPVTDGMNRHITAAAVSQSDFIFQRILIKAGDAAFRRIVTVGFVHQGRTRPQGSIGK